MKTIIKKYSPNFLLNLIKLFSLIINYLYDLKRYYVYSDSPKRKTSVSHLKTRMTENYHAIEKGLSLKDIRLGFGKDRIKELLEIIELYIEKKYDTKDYVYQNCLQVLKEYVDYHTRNNYNVDYLAEKLEKFSVNSDLITGGTILVKKDSLLRHSRGDFESLALNRHSIRNFSNEKIDYKKVSSAIELAGRTPSSCNKQPSRVYTIKDKNLINKALSFQSGNIGFGHLVDCLLIVTFDIESFNGAKNRNQGYIDGGMFAMSLIYSLQFQGLGSCALNWASDKVQDQSLREEINIKKSENVIMMIAVGNLPETLRVPKSLRLKNNDVLKEIVN